MHSYTLITEWHQTSLISLAQETVADHQPPAKHLGITLGSPRGAEPPQSHHPGLLLIHKEELQALGCLSKPHGSTGKHQYLLKCSQKPSSIPRVRVSPKAGAAHKVGLCTSSLMGCSQPERQGSPHVLSMGKWRQGAARLWGSR